MHDSMKHIILTGHWITLPSNLGMAEQYQPHPVVAHDTHHNDNILRCLRVAF